MKENKAGEHSQIYNTCTTTGHTLALNEIIFMKHV